MIPWAGAQVETEQGLAITHGPYLQQLTETSVTIIWKTSENCVSWIEYGKADNLNSFPTYGSVVKTARSSHQGLIDANEKIHEITISDLEPGCEYRYRVFSKEILEFRPYEVTYGGTIASDVLRFSTLDSSKDAFSFLAITDIHGDAERLDAKLDAVSWEGIDLVFYTGDSVDYFEDASGIFDGFLDTSVEHFASRVPLMFVRGNHETRGSFARHLYEYFPTTSGEYYFSFDHGPVHFIVLDTGEDKEDSHPVYAGLVDFDAYRREQAEWLKTEIRTEAFQQAAFRVAILHIPPYGSRDAHGTLHVRQMWNELLNEGGVDLALSGHTHRFAHLDPTPGEHQYPILISGREHTVRVDASGAELLVTVTDEEGGIVDTFSVKRRQR
jgi:predicted phosphodiesterase